MYVHQGSRRKFVQGSRSRVTTEQGFCTHDMIGHLSECVLASCGLLAERKFVLSQVSSPAGFRTENKVGKLFFELL